MKKVKLYTDGACSGNPGPGGWAAVLLYGKWEKELSGGEARTTNNRMELEGVIRGLEALLEPCAVDVYTDSQYIVNAVNKGWVYGWQKKGWMKNNKEEAKNPDLWQKILTLMQKHKVTFHWVKGHAENVYNNRCDELAVMESKRAR